MPATPKAQEFPYKTYLNILHEPLELIDVQKLADACTDKWYNQTLCKVNDSVVRMAVIQGEYHWHEHSDIETAQRLLKPAKCGPKPWSRELSALSSLFLFALVGVRNSSLAGTGFALHRVDLASCQHGLLHHRKPRSIAGCAPMLFDLLRHGVHLNPFHAALFGGPPTVLIATRRGQRFSPV